MADERSRDDIAKLRDLAIAGSFTATVTPSTSGTVTLDPAKDSLQYTLGPIVEGRRRVNIHGRLTVSAVAAPVGVFRINIPFSPVAAAEESGNSAAGVFLNAWNALSGPPQVQAAAGIPALDLYCLVLATGSVDGATAQMSKAGATITVNIGFDIAA